MSNACIDIAMIMLCWLVLRPKRCFLFVRMNGKVQKLGLVVKANSCIAPIGTETKNGNKKHRKRKRSKRKKD